MLAIHKGKRIRNCAPPLKVEEIVAWVHAHFGRAGRWPPATSGSIPESREETWNSVYRALKDGKRGMNAGTSLSDLLRSECHALLRGDSLTINIEDILRWADAYHAQHGKWPSKVAGSIPGSPNLNWDQVNRALVNGATSLPGKSSLVKLLSQHFGKRNMHELPPMTVDQIAYWAEAHHKRTGNWPATLDAAIPEAAGEMWQTVKNAIRRVIGIDHPMHAKPFSKNARAAESLVDRHSPQF